MTTTDRIAIYVLFSFLVVGIILLTAAHSQDAPTTTCQTPQPCKVIVLSPDEERALIGQNMIFDSALQGRFLDLNGPITYFRDKLRNAPAGTPQKSQ